MMVFFLSVGLLLDFAFIWKHFFQVITLLIVITLIKTCFNIFILHLFKQPWPRAFLAGLVLSQMGEFAFVLATVAADVKVIDPEGMQLIVTLAALSLALSPLWLMAARRLHDLAPKGIRTVGELMNTVYRPELIALESLTKACKRVLERFKRTINKDKDA
jgi:CPA2 family monovalent cation:H+ antiporter-2